MDVFERVREVNAGAGLSEDRISGARARLLQGIDAGRTAERKRLLRRPMFLIAGAVAGVAAVTATAVVFAQPSDPAPAPIEAVPVATPDPRVPGETIPKPDPTAGAVVTEPFPGTTPQAGQYVRVVQNVERLSYRDSQGQIFDWRSYQGSSLVSALLSRDRLQVSVPADRSGDWYNENGPFAERVEFFPRGQTPGDQSAWDAAMPVQTDVSGWWSTGGLGGDASPPRGSDAYYDALPRDPQALLDSLRGRIAEWASSPQEADDALLESLTSEMLSNIAPPDVRETYLQALPLSGLVQTRTSGSGDLVFEFRRDPARPRTETISVAAATGWVTEHTVRYDRSEFGASDIVPSDVPDIRTTFTVTIVDPAR